MNPQNNLSPDTITRTLSLITGGGVAEIRLFGALRNKGTVAGYLDADHFAEVPKALAKYSHASGIYLVLNELNPALQARASNRFEEYIKATTADHDILRRRWLPIDCDPVRPSGISSTDEEHQKSLDLAKIIARYLHDELGISTDSLILADSGNGAHLLVSIDLPNDDDSRILVERCLKGLAHRFNTDTVKVDTSTFNAARIFKLYGTVARKGDSIPDRPHRMSNIIHAPTEVMPVSPDVLATVAALAPTEGKQQKAPTSAGTGRKLADDATHIAEERLSWLLEWCRRFELSPDAPQRYNGRHNAGGWKLQIDCPFNPDHTKPDAALYVMEGGEIGFRCSHDSCQGRDWIALRLMLDKEYREKRENGEEPTITGRTSEVDWSLIVPRSLSPELLPVPRFNPPLLPDTLRPWVLDVTERGSFCVEYVATAALVALSSVVGRQVGIKPKRYDDWLVVPNLWGAAIGSPGVRKSPAVSEVLKPLERLSIEAREQYEREKEAFDACEVVRSAQQKAAKSNLDKEARKGASSELLHLLAQDAISGSRDESPTCRRYVVNDVTTEKLGEILCENPNGLLLHRDELTGFLRTLDKMGHETDRAFYLESWNGTGSFSYDRIGRGTIHIPSVCLSLYGTIQPQPFAAYLRRCGFGEEADGLVSRFQLMVYPDPPSRYVLVDRYPNAEAKQKAYEVFLRLAHLDRESIEAVQDGDSFPFLRFDNEAQECFTKWLTDLENRLLCGIMSDAMKMHLAKYRSLLPSLALLFHLIDGGRGVIPVEQFERAKAWCAFLEAHARRLYQLAFDGDTEAASSLGERLKQSLPNPFTVRDVVRKGWGGLSEQREVEKAAGVLTDRGWLYEMEERSDREDGRGRPSTKYYIHPAILKAKETGKKWE
jgi:hypothetical protein